MTHIPNYNPPALVPPEWTGLELADYFDVLGACLASGRPPERAIPLAEYIVERRRRSER